METEPINYAESIQVFDSCNMPGEFGEEETSILVSMANGHNGSNNDTYWKWYPSCVEEAKAEVKEVGLDEFNQFKSNEAIEAGTLLNEWLVKHGMIWDKNNKYFHVLIWVNW